MDAVGPKNSDRKRFWRNPFGTDSQCRPADPFGLCTAEIRRRLHWMHSGNRCSHTGLRPDQTVQFFVNLPSKVQAKQLQLSIPSLPFLRRN